MPSYFFHLAFELYPSPEATAQAPISSHLHPAYIPLRGSDIFKTPLPVHRASSWSSPEVKKPSHRRAKTSTASDLSASPTKRSPHHRRLSNLTNNTPGDIHNSPVPLHTKAAASSVSPAPATKDWRFGSVSILSIDMAPRSPEDGPRPRGKSLNHAPVAANSGGLATMGKYVPSDPKNTEVGWGVVHLYREAKETPGLYDEDASSSSSEIGKTGTAQEKSFNEECTTLCILAVPSYMTPSDFLGYVGEQTREDVSHFRLIRTARANKYMVLMKFREAKKAREWQKEWNGKLFNSMEPENCHVVFVRSVEFASAITPNSSFPDMTHDPFTPANPTQQAAPTAPLPTTTGPSSPVDSSTLASSFSTKPIPPPTPSLVELPTCPVCLERMDETTGLLTILCQHVFHCGCLSKWRGSGCPVCRYTQSDPYLGTRHGHTSDGEQPENECSVCGATANLWICLICGNTGCGRYDSAHAFAHWEASGHSYAMDVATQHVWDYVGDGYVHRLIQSKTDGKLVDLPAAYSSRAGDGGANGSMTGFGEDMLPREKVENMSMEYTYLLTTQLDTQRTYFEEQLERAVDKASRASAAAEEASRAASQAIAQMSVLQASSTESNDTVARLEKEVARLTTRSEKSAELARKLGRDLQEERALKNGMSEKVSHLEKKFEEVNNRCHLLEVEKAELAEQNRDLSFFISGQEKLRELEAEGGGLEEGEVQEGTVSVPEKKGRKKGKGRR